MIDFSQLKDFTIPNEQTLWFFMALILLGFFTLLGKNYLPSILPFVIQNRKSIQDQYESLLEIQEETIKRMKEENVEFQKNIQEKYDEFTEKKDKEGRELKEENLDLKKKIEDLTISNSVLSQRVVDIEKEMMHYKNESYINSQKASHYEKALKQAGLVEYIINNSANYEEALKTLQKSKVAKKPKKIITKSN